MTPSGCDLIESTLFEIKNEHSVLPALGCVVCNHRQRHTVRRPTGERNIFKPARMNRFRSEP